MPYIESTYSKSGLLANGHVSTLVSAKLRRVNAPKMERDRIILPDKDFIDIDWSYCETPGKQVIIMLHGLEGNSKRSYMLGCALHANRNGWDVASVNFRGCSGESNFKYYSYNAGKTDDLEILVNYIRTEYNYAKIALVGYSLGGNMLLKYLGEGNPGARTIYKAVAISAPLSLKGSLARLEERQNWLYRNVFLWSMKKKLANKQREFPDKLDKRAIKSIKSLLDFDNIYTAPAHGFKDAYDYYAKSSSLQFLPAITTPTYILNAQNDTFLSPDCFPKTLAAASKYIHLESPPHGGHVGFVGPDNIYYNELKTLSFLNEH